MESRAALVQTLKADIDNAQKKTKECMEVLEKFTGCGRPSAAARPAAGWHT